MTVPLLYLSQQRGHANPTTTLKYYARWIPTGDQRYVDVLDHAAEKSWHQNLAPTGQSDDRRTEVFDLKRFPSLPYPITADP